MIELRDLSAGYNGQPVLNRVSLTFPDGQVTSLLGPNGCGKSTLLRTVMGFNNNSSSHSPAAEGEILVDGVPRGALTSRQLARQIAYLPQNRSVPNITAHRMVLHGRFPYLSYPRRYRVEDYKMADKALRWVGAEGWSNRPVGQLSGGQRQKVYLAMALAQDTQNILMDEPTTWLDVSAQMEVMALARRLAGEGGGGGKTVVMVLHDLCLALRWSHQVAVLDQGGLRFCGTPEEASASGVLEEVFGVKLGRLRTEDGWLYYYG